MKTMVCVLLGLFATTAWAEDAPKSVPPAASSERIQAALAELDKLVTRAQAESGIPGIAIAVVQGDQVIYQKCLGVREAGKPERIDADTVMQLASVSKPIASTVLAVLVGEGMIGWDDRIINHDPTFRMYDDYVTRELRLRDFLCHRSGLPDHAGDLLEDLGYDSQQVLYRLRYQPPDSSFRAGYAYTNFGYSEAGYAAAKAVGKTWAEVANEELFAPLGMKSTSYRFADYERAPNRALLHVREKGKWIAKNTRQPDAQAPAGGASSTLNDLTRWLRLQLAEGKWDGRQLVDAAALNETHKPQFVLGFQPDEGRVSAYGLGWNVNVERGGRTFLRHSGEFGLGMRTEVSVLPSEKLAVAVLVNAAPTGIPEGLTESFYDLVIYGEPQRDWLEFANRMFDEQEKADRARERDYTRVPANPTAALPLSAYVGKYQNDFVGEIEVVEKPVDNQPALILRLGPKLHSFALRHYDRDTFIYQPSGEMAGGPSGVRFAVVPDGVADSVLIENLNIHGQGTLRRVK